MTLAVIVAEPPVALGQLAKKFCSALVIVPERFVVQVPPPLTVSTPLPLIWKDATQTISALPAVAVTVPEAEPLPARSSVTLTKAMAIYKVKSPDALNTTWISAPLGVTGNPVPVSTHATSRCAEAATSPPTVTALDWK